MTLSFNQLSRLSILAVLLTALFSATTTFAQEPQVTCGSFIFGSEYSTPIENCDNPFGRTDDLANFMIGNEVAINGQTYLINQQGISDYGFVGENYFNPGPASVFRHEGADYVAVDTDFAYPERDAVERVIADFFESAYPSSDSLTIARYTEIYDADYKYPYFYLNSESQYFDVQLNQYIEDVYYELESYIEQNVDSVRAVLLPGTYTAVFVDTDEGPVQSLDDNQNIFQKLWDSLVPKAYAYYYVRTVTFTLTDTPPEPEGASSVLFIPGIMGSRLFEESAECSPYQTNVPYEQERWFAFGDCAQLRMSTNFLGQSLNNLYTKTGRQGIVDDVRIVSNIYENFLDSLQELEDEEIINEYAVLPYDWRLGLDAIISSELNSLTGHVVGGETTTVQEGYLYDLVTELAEGSANGKVTIVAHSNGGLVAKHFLDALDKADDPLLGKIENLILVAVPQVGTPEAVIGITHGLELGPAGLVVSQQTARQLSNKMNFAHHLLPTLRYFDSVDTPVISFEEGSVTNAWRSAWGGTVSNRDELHGFLDDDSMRTKPLPADLSTPEVVDGALLNYAKVVDAVQAGFEVPETLKVYQIAGTGLETPSGLTYFTDRYCVNRILFSCTEYADKLGYRVNMVIDGDESVVVPSALALAGDDRVERWWLNFQSYNSAGILGVENINRRHKDILEVSEVHNFINQVLLGTSSVEYNYLQKTAPVFNDEEPRLAFQLHSPLDMSLTTADGGEISSSTETIEGATYRRYGELQYISVPSNEEDFKLLLKGTAPGSFTLDIEKSENGEVERQTYSAIPSTSSTIVEVQIESPTNIQDVVLAVDYEGNGVVDVSYNIQGIITGVVTYKDLFESIKNLNLKRVFEKVLLNTAQAAEKFYNQSLTKEKFSKMEAVTLEVLKKQLQVYVKIKVLSEVQRQNITKIIDGLLSK